MAPSAICPRCGNHDETFPHWIQDCTHSTEVWYHIGFTNSDFFFSSCACDWLNLFAVGIWWSWRHHNLACLTNEVWSINRLSFIQSSTKVIKNAFPKNGPTVSWECFIKWNYLNHSCTILNVDGSYLGTHNEMALEVSLEILQVSIFMVSLGSFLIHMTYYLLSS